MRGIELIASAVDDATANATANGITNARFVAGKAEDVLPAVLADAPGPYVSVVDPPRCGLRRRAAGRRRALKAGGR